MKRFLFSVLVGLYVSLTSFAQVVTPLAWSGNHLNAFEQTVLLDSAWSGIASVKAYNGPGGRLISALLQPTVTRSGNALFIRFAATANMSNSTYVTISTGTVVRRAGYLSLGYTSTVIAPGGTDAGGVGSGIINTDMVQGLPLLLAKKVDINAQSARDQAQDNQLAGFGSALSQTNQNVAGNTSAIADRYTKAQSDGKYALIGSGPTVTPVSIGAVPTGTYTTYINANDAKNLAQDGQITTKAAQSALDATNQAVSSTNANVTSVSAQVGANTTAITNANTNTVLGWVYSQAFRLVSASRDANGAITTASIVWPDGNTGTFTTITASTSFPGAIDSYRVTYIKSGVTTTYTQPAVTRDASGAVAAQPSIVIN